MDIANTPVLPQAFSCGHPNQAATIRGLEKLSICIDTLIDWGWSHFKGHDMQNCSKEHDIKWGFHLLYNPQVVELAERDNEILMKQIKLLTGKTTLAG